jgi:arylsulfatase A-like enzyme
VPLFVRGPGVPAGKTVEKLAVNTDFAPTFAELANVGFPADGRSLVPLLRGQDPTWRSAVLLERLGKEGSDEEANDDEGGGKGKAKDKGKAKGKDKGKVGRGDQSAFEGIRTDTHKYVEYGSGEKELYDLKADPYELENIYESADPSLVEDLKTRLDVLKSCSEAGCREAENTS